MNKKHGGKREGAGRKRLPKGERKIGLTIYMPETIIKMCGGEYKCKRLMEDLLVSKARKNVN